jgi:hypothetical protein
MAYSDFTLREAVTKFGLAVVDVPDLLGHVAPVEPSALLKAMMPVFLPLAEAVSTEKARSEWLVAPILGAVRAQFQNRFSLFSGIEFDVDPDEGLAGRCDFIVSSSPEQLFLQAPIAAITEAKNEDIKSGLGPCVAGMVAEARVNAREGTAERPGYGAVTTGTEWRFLRLEGNRLEADMRQHYISDLPKLVGLIAHIAGVA